MPKHFFTAALLVAAMSTSAAQQPSPRSETATGAAFEVASVKPNSARTGMPIVGLMFGGRVIAPNVTLFDLVRTALGLDATQIAGGPGWIAVDRFAVEAQADRGSSDDDIRVMLRKLLEERFRLATHMESRELPAYALVVVQGKPGGQRRASGQQCASPTPPAGLPIPPPPPPPPPSGGMRPLTPVLGGRCATIVVPGYLSAREITMTALAARLSPIVGRRVLDRTGLAGNFDLDLTYTPDTQAPGFGPPNGLPPPAPDAPSIFTAVQEQLGLRLQSIRDPTDVLVIDHAERPEDN